MSGRLGYLEAVEPDATALQMFEEDLAELGYVMNVTRLWAHDAVAMQQLFELARGAARNGQLSIRARLLVVLATSAARGSSYCILAWSTKFAGELEAATASAVVNGAERPPGLTDAEVALVRWCRMVAARPRGTTTADVAALRDTGWGDRQIFELTVFAAARLAFASVNDALGVLPDHELTSGVTASLVADVEACDIGGGRWPTARILVLIAGLVTSLGVLLGVLVDPWFLVLPALAGPNQLLLAGAGWCPMSLVVSRFKDGQRAWPTS